MESQEVLTLVVLANLGAALGLVGWLVSHAVGRHLRAAESIAESLVRMSSHVRLAAQADQSWREFSKPPKEDEMLDDEQVRTLLQEASDAMARDTLGQNGKGLL